MSGVPRAVSSTGLTGVQAKWGSPCGIGMLAEVCREESSLQRDLAHSKTPTRPYDFILIFHMYVFQCPLNTRKIQRWKALADGQALGNCLSMQEQRTSNNAIVCTAPGGHHPATKCVPRELTGAECKKLLLSHPCLHSGESEEEQPGCSRKFSGRLVLRFGGLMGKREDNPRQ